MRISTPAVRSPATSGLWAEEGRTSAATRWEVQGWSCQCQDGLPGLGGRMVMRTYEVVGLEEAVDDALPGQTGSAGNEDEGVGGGHIVCRGESSLNL